MIEFELENEKYVGEFLKDDIEAFCHVSEKYKYRYYAIQFNGIENGYKSFNLSAFVFGGAWFAYRGLMKEAFLVDLMGWVFTGVLQVIWSWMLLKEEGTLAVAIIGMVIYALYLGFKSTPYYYGYVKNVLTNKGLAGRKAEEFTKEENLEIEKKLLSEGAGSYKRAILHFVFFKVIGKLCWISLWFTLYGGSYVKFY